jgi:PKD repeat protein
MARVKRRVLFVALVAVIALMGLGFPAVVTADVPCRFHGWVQFNGENVPAGTVITAWLEGPYIGPWTAHISVVPGSGYTAYWVDVPTDNPGVPKDGGVEGDTVHFSMTLPGGVPLPAPSATWTQNSGAFVWHDLYLTGPQVPVAEFSGTPLTCCAPLEVHFTDLSTGVPTSWEWDFGDGSPHSFVQNPIHVYTQPSTGNTAVSYGVSLKATNALGFDTETKTGYITVHPPLKADFTATPKSGPPSLNVNFTDLSTGTISSWDWNFGDGSPHSSLKNPGHTYAAGTYDVTLVITGHGGSNTTIKQDYIVVSVGGILQGHVNLQGRPAPPHASWITNLTVTFLQSDVAVRTETVTTDNEGKFAIPGVTPGTYDIGVKSPRALSQLETGVVMASGTTTPVDFGTLREGDVDNNDTVNIIDFGLLADAFGSVSGAANWDDRCDFNRDGVVNIMDFGLLSDNFGQSGEMV